MAPTVPSYFCIARVIIEKELGVRVERLDILRDPPSQALLGLLTSRSPPFLYNRESCQVVSIASPKASNGNEEKRIPVAVEKDKIRSWAKGRLPPRENAGEPSGKSPVVLSREEIAIDQDELLEMNLTPLQRKGRKAIKERTEEKAK
jgi:hypothetical protein